VGNGYIVNSIPVFVGDTRFMLYHLAHTNVQKSDNIAEILHCHLFYEIRVAINGSHEYVFDDKRIMLSKGELLVIPPGKYHYSLVNDGSFKEMVCSLLPEKTEGTPKIYTEYCDMLDKFWGVPVKFPPQLEKAVAELLELQQSISNDRLSGVAAEKSFEMAFREQLLAASVVYELGKCLGVGMGKPLEKTSAPELNTKRVDMKTALLLELMSSVNDITISEIAQQLNYSEKHTARLIKEVYGTNFSEYQRNKKLATIKKLLENPEISIGMAASRAGYKSSASLYRDFHRFENMTPLEYREKLKKEKDNYNE